MYPKKTKDVNEMENEPVFYLCERNGAYEPLYITPTMGDGSECMYLHDLVDAKWERVKVRLPEVGERTIDVLSEEFDGIKRFYLPWSAWAVA